MRKIFFILILLFASNSYAQIPGTEEGAKQLLNQFLTAKTMEERKTLTMALRPTDADYAAYFEPELAAVAKERYASLWEGGGAMIGPKDGQTQLLLYKATVDELKTRTGDSANFPGGYERAAPKIKSGFTVYRFKFVKPGEDIGMAFDGLVYVNGHWALFPKPWRLLEEKPSN